jgi:opacity protein-like surface antigen
MVSRFRPPTGTRLTPPAPQQGGQTMRTLLLAAACFLFLQCISPPAAWAKRGFFAGLEAPYTMMWGDLNGEKALVGSKDTILLPDIDGGLGYGLFVGMGVSETASWEISFMQTFHDGRWKGLKADVHYFMIDANGKLYFRTGRALRPYGLAGFGLHIVDIHNGSTNGSDVGDGLLTGTAFNLGAGADYYLRPEVSIGGAAVLRYVLFRNARGVKSSGTIDDYIDGYGVSFILNTAYHF